jgi:hypothetical protein
MRGGAEGGAEVGGGGGDDVGVERGGDVAVVIARGDLAHAAAAAGAVQAPDGAVGRRVGNPTFHGWFHGSTLSCEVKSSCEDEWRG